MGVYKSTDPKEKIRGFMRSKDGTGVLVKLIMNQNPTVSLLLLMSVDMGAALLMNILNKPHQPHSRWLPG